ncbi:unnamed protein product [Bursaphelenchus okinawaensis]|uniref:Lysozyme n=1 Tax=Bursaphelenchus okinawaensis TaxID=465554 RepID=A0A811LBR5_9BILA|nr:unnamed protein product [Bursaphelenchus okinawaensis]CAG9121104.1 unnamed protein product [Bursaphelenchus okinawaensis]
MFKLLSTLLLATAVASLPATPLPAGKIGTAPAAFGIDTTYQLTASQVDCLVRSGYKVGFFRLYNRNAGDRVGVSNVLAAYNGRLAFEVFVTPYPSGSGSGQFESAYAFAKTNNLQLNRVWLQVTSPSQWSNTFSSNVRYINDFVRAAYARNVNVGLYTNWYDYEEITGNSRSISNTDIWYWHVLGAGSSAETSRDFVDFRSFGPFVGYPKVKQYGIAENTCSAVVNQNVFPGGSFKLNGEESMPIGLGASLIQDNKTKQ